MGRYHPMLALLPTHRLVSQLRLLNLSGRDRNERDTGLQTGVSFSLVLVWRCSICGTLGKTIEQAEQHKRLHDA